MKRLKIVKIYERGDVEFVRLEVERINEEA